MSCWVRFKSSCVFNYSQQFDKVFIVCSMKLMTVISLTFSCWLPWDTEAMFLFLDSDFMLFLSISVLGSYCCFLGCFNNFISYLGSLISCWYFSCFTMLVFELLLDGLFSCLGVPVAGLSELNILCVFLLVL